MTKMTKNGMFVRKMLDTTNNIHVFVHDALELTKG